MSNLFKGWRSSGGDDTMGVDLGIGAGAVKTLAVATGNAGWSKFLTYFFLCSLPSTPQLPSVSSPAAVSS